MTNLRMPAHALDQSNAIPAFLERLVRYFVDQRLDQRQSIPSFGQSAGRRKFAGRRRTECRRLIFDNDADFATASDQNQSERSGAASITMANDVRTNFSDGQSKIGTLLLANVRALQQIIEPSPDALHIGTRGGHTKAGCITRHFDSSYWTTGA